jgi:hypothetical protein
MDMNTLLLLMMASGFLLVSVVLSFKFIFDIWLEYIQVKTGIQVIQTAMEEQDDQEEDPPY